MNIGYHASKLFEALLNLKHAKRVGSTIYAHSSVLPVARLLEALGESPPAKDIVFRADKRTKTVAVLHYPNFSEVGHPKLESVLRIQVETGDMHHHHYHGRKNRPIVHRKELLVAPNHALYNTFARLTQQEEEAGLFAEPKRIGWSSMWEELLKSKGLRIEGHELKSIAAGD